MGSFSLPDMASQEFVSPAAFGQSSMRPAEICDRQPAQK
jgi:hypothetical protein